MPAARSAMPEADSDVFSSVDFCESGLTFSCIWSVTPLRLVAVSKPRMHRLLQRAAHPESVMVVWLGWMEDWIGLWKKLRAGVLAEAEDCCSGRWVEDDVEEEREREREGGGGAAQAALYTRAPPSLPACAR